MQCGSLWPQVCLLSRAWCMTCHLKHGHSKSLNCKLYFGLSNFTCKKKVTKGFCSCHIAMVVRARLSLLWNPFIMNGKCTLPQNKMEIEWKLCTAAYKNLAAAADVKQSRSKHSARVFFLSAVHSSHGKYKQHLKGSSYTRLGLCMFRS